MPITITYFNPDTNILSYTNTTGSNVQVVPRIKVDAGSSPILFWGQVFTLGNGSGTFTLNLYSGSGTNIAQADQLTWGGQVTFMTALSTGTSPDTPTTNANPYNSITDPFTVMPTTQTMTITGVASNIISYTSDSAWSAVRIFKNGSVVNSGGSPYTFAVTAGSSTVALPAGVTGSAGDSFELRRVINGTVYVSSNVFTIAAPNPSASSLTINSIAPTTNSVAVTSAHAYTYAAVATIVRRGGATTLTSDQFTVANGAQTIALTASSVAINIESGDTVTIASTAAYGSVAVSSTYTQPTPGSTSVVINSVDIATSTINYTFTSAVFSQIVVELYINGTSTIPCTLLSGTNTLDVSPTTLSSGMSIAFVAMTVYGGAAVSASYTIPGAPPSPPSSTSVVINSVNLAASPSPLLNYTFTSATYASIQANLTINGALFAPLGTPSIYTLHVGTADTMAPIGLTGGDVLQFIATADYGGSAVSATYTIPGGAPVPTPSPAPAVPCVCAGTMIRTAAGERAVETLAAGDFVLTADGREVAIKGIYTTEIAACTGRNAPYVVAAGAFGRGLPSADLTISPGHALMARPGQWMIPCHTTDPALRAKMSRYANGQEVTYYHVELPNYLQDTFVANGVVSEAYGLNWAKTYKGPSVYTQMSNGYFTRAGGAVARTYKAAAARK